MRKQDGGYAEEKFLVEGFVPEGVHGDERTDGTSDGCEEEQGFLGYASCVGLFREAFVPRIGDEGDDVNRHEIDEQYPQVHFFWK